MGAVCSGGGGAKKKGDLSLKGVKMEETKLDKFDSAFKEPGQVLGKIVTLNNDLCQMLKNLAALCALNPPPAPKDIIKEMFANLKKEVKEFDMSKLNIDVDKSKLLEGDCDVKVTMGDMDIKKVLPEKWQKAWDAIFDDAKGMIAVIKNSVKEMKTGMDSLEEAKAAIEGLPTDPDEVKTMAEEAKLETMELLKLPGKIKHNMAQFARAPEIFKGFQATVGVVLDSLAALVGDNPNTEQEAKEKKAETKKGEAKKAAPKKKEEGGKEEDEAEPEAAAEAEPEAAEAEKPEPAASEE
eukprot:gb/GEZN01006412.1/.p1 GENE.gb/GEZN01006412.1/~~gb/GEZN01006412.1/.p1  ORF type:complete len:296 (-),score=96.16 gb/GEZN01006412.1/:755-1642(-)